ncbi:hypothetical protein B0H14DRAFT_3132760 [Mycena olivaceomarginata]|nr:hypothetical protein B0H14DRAFT_3132760 [Mycena olivaceomarginata]
MVDVVSLDSSPHLPPSPPLPPILYAPELNPQPLQDPPRLKIVLLFKTSSSFVALFYAIASGSRKMLQAPPSRCFKLSAPRVAPSISHLKAVTRTASISRSPTRQLRCLNTINGRDWTRPGLTTYVSATGIIGAALHQLKVRNGGIIDGTFKTRIPSYFHGEWSTVHGFVTRAGSDEIQEDAVAELEVRINVNVPEAGYQTGFWTPDWFLKEAIGHDDMLFVPDGK